METLEIRWGTSRGRDTEGYTTCSLRADGRKVAACNGGGYDMRGTVLGNWLARTYADRLLALRPKDMPKQSHWERAKNPKHANDGRRVDEGRYFYGLTFHDPNFDPGTAVVGQGCDDRTLGLKAKGKTVAQAESDGESHGLERYQSLYRASSPVPTKRHRIPSIDGACGESSVAQIGKAIGISWQLVGPWRANARTQTYIIHDTAARAVAV